MDGWNLPDEINHPQVLDPKKNDFEKSKNELCIKKRNQRNSIRSVRRHEPVEKIGDSYPKT